MHICQLTGSISRLAGGPFASVSRLSQEVAANGPQVDILGTSDSCSKKDMPHWLPLRPYAIDPFFPRKFGFSPDFSTKVQQLSPHLLHCHGLWMYHTCLAYQYGRKAGVPYIISPRGMLEPWAWENSRWKKLPLWWLWEQRNIRHAAVLHATAEQEANHLRKRGLRQPIAIIPNGVDLPAYKPKRKRGQRMALFLSRIHPKKGLPMLLDAWSELQPEGWELVIAGPDERNHEKLLKDKVAQRKIRTSVRFHGPAYGTVKDELFRNADLFILPTLSENFGIAIAEALSYGVPVITTTAAPWQEIQQTRSGWWVAPETAPITLALREAIALPPEELAQKGERGRQLIEKTYSWTRVAQDMSAVYEHIIFGSARPPSIHTT